MALNNLAIYPYSYGACCASRTAAISNFRRTITGNTDDSLSWTGFIDREAHWSGGRYLNMSLNCRADQRAGHSVFKVRLRAFQACLGIGESDVMVADFQLEGFGGVNKTAACRVVFPAE